MKKALVLFLMVATAAVNAAEPFKGRLEWGRRVALGMPVSGVVKDVAVTAGHEVEKGQLLVRLDPRPFNAKLAEAEARQHSTEQKMLEAKRELNRANQLYERTVLSNTELEQAQTAYQTAKAQFDDAKAKLQLARYHVEYSELHAPFNGIIGRVNTDVGQTIVSRLQVEPLVTIVDNKHMIARVKVTADDISQFSVGRSIMVKVSGRIFSGRVAMVGIEPLEVDTGIAYDVDVEFLSKDIFLRAGQNVTVVLP